MNGELCFETQVIRDISDDISGINSLLKKYSERLEEINICGAILSDVSASDPSKTQLSKALSHSVDSIKEYSKELSVLEKALVDIAYTYDKAENEIGKLFSYSFIPSAAGLIHEKNEANQNYREDLATGNFDNIKTRHISSNELMLPDWLMYAVIQFSSIAED